MKLLPGENEREFILEFPDVSEFDRFFEEAERAGFFHLETSALPAAAVFRARCAESPRTRRIRPVTIQSAANGCNILLREDASIPQPPPVQPPAPTVVPEEAGTPAGDQPESEEVRKSLTDKIRAMPVTERVTLALKADLMERRVLMQENNPKIHEFLLRNTRITDQEIAFLARNPAAPMQTILSIIGHREWMKRDSIRSAVLLNPRTPPHIVMDLLPAAPSNDVVKMSHSKYLREDIQAAVLQELKKRGIRVKKVVD